MATGRDHTNASLGLLIGTGIGYYSGYIVDPVSIPVVLAGLALSGFLVSPDLDVDNGNISNFYIRRWFKTDIFWNVFWRPYRIGKKHRGLSHIPVLSTLFRFLYLVFPPIIVFFNDQETPILQLFLLSIFSFLFSIPLLIGAYFLFLFNLEINIIYFLYGMCLADLLHIFMDQIF
jgi:uncharacterized metal-binding protein